MGKCPWVVWLNVWENVWIFFVDILVILVTDRVFQPSKWRVVVLFGIQTSENEHGYAATRPAAVVLASNLRRRRGGKLLAPTRSVFIKILLCVVYQNSERVDAFHRLYR